MLCWVCYLMGNFGAFSSLAIILLRKIYCCLSNCVVDICVLCTFLTVSFGGMPSVIVAFPCQTNILFAMKQNYILPV